MPPLSFALLAALLLAAGCSRHESPSSAAQPPAVKVRVAAVEASVLPGMTEVPGTVRPVRRAALAARVMGTVADLPVALGQVVREGDVLARLSTAEAEARVAQARSQLNLVRRDLARERTLVSQGASTAETARALEDRLTGAEAQLREAQVWLGYAEIRAPFDGVVSRRPANAGDLANPGQTLLEIEEIRHFEIEVGVPESLASALRTGNTLACQTDTATFTGTLREISSATDSASRTIGVKLAVPAGTGVRSGQFVRVLVPGANHPVLLVPAAAVSLNGQMEQVFAIGEGSRAALRLVRTGATHGNHVEILSGLAVGERIILDPSPSLRDGQALEVQP